MGFGAKIRIGALRPGTVRGEIVGRVLIIQKIATEKEAKKSASVKSAKETPGGEEKLIRLRFYF